MGLGQFCWVRRRSYVKEKSSSSANSTPIPQFSLPNSNVTQGSKGTHGQLYCPSLLFPGLLQKYTTSWGGKAYSGLEWAMGDGQVQTTAAWPVLFRSLFVFSFFAHGKSNRSNTQEPNELNAWPEMSLVQADNYGPVTPPSASFATTLGQEQTPTDPEDEWSRPSHLSPFWVVFCLGLAEKKNHPPVCSIACVFLLYISLMNSPITNLNQMSKR